MCTYVGVQVPVCQCQMIENIQKANRRLQKTLKKMEATKEKNLGFNSVWRHALVTAGTDVEIVDKNACKHKVISQRIYRFLTERTFVLAYVELLQLHSCVQFLTEQ